MSREDGRQQVQAASSAGTGRGAGQGLPRRRRSADTTVDVTRSGSGMPSTDSRMPRRRYQCLDRLGARPWADRARNELRAAGVATVRSRPAAAPTAALTPQELQIATLAATGLTNKQIGGRLFLSHRTVGAHLHRAFPKLGITSRAALAAALEAHPTR